MRIWLRLTALSAGYFGATHAAGMARVRFAGAARLAEAASLRRDTGWGLRAAWSAEDLAIEGFCCEVKHHG
jgi:hypothetical protein